MEQLISPQLFITTDSICSVHIHKLLTIYWDDTLGNLTSGTVAAACCVLSIWRQPSWRMSQKHSSHIGRQRDRHRGATGPSLRSVAPQIVLWMGWAQQTSHLPQIYLPKMHMIKFIAQVRAEINQEQLYYYQRLLRQQQQAILRTISWYPDQELQWCASAAVPGQSRSARRARASPQLRKGAY